MNMKLIEEVTASQIRKDMPEIKIGDTVKVGVIINEGNKTRTQDYQGLVIAMKGEGVSKTMIVRKNSSGVGVERVFPINSPMLAYVKVISHGQVRRAKLFFLRGRKGKSAKITQKI